MENRLSIEENASTRGVGQTGQEPQRGGFATSRRAQQHQQLSVPDTEVEFGETNLARRVHFGEILQGNGGHLLLRLGPESAIGAEISICPPNGNWMGASWPTNHLS